MSTLVDDLQNRRKIANTLGCASCAAVFVIPSLIIALGAWTAIVFLPLLILIFTVLAIVGWVTAGNRKADIARLNMPTTATAAPASKPQPSATPKAQTLQSRIEKGKRAGL